MLRHLPATHDPRVLVGLATADDAAVYRLDAKRAIVETADFFTPVVDDPFDFGRIAAANALSDIWAMGARPLFALNLVCFPTTAKTLPLEVLSEILRGGAEVCAEAECPVVGGHSIDDPEPKFGLAVTGLVHPKRVLANRGARPGDVLLLTKPLGTGILTTALKRGFLADAPLQRITAQMAELNRAAGEVFARGAGTAVHALTDVTGFGLLGHLLGMMRASGVRARLRAGEVPVHEEVWSYAATGVVPGGSKANLEYYASAVTFADGLRAEMPIVLADAQTNGGLLASVDPRRAPALVRAIERAGKRAWAVGEVVAGEPGIEVAS